MERIVFIIFVEILLIAITAIIHLCCYILKQEFLLLAYPIVAIVTFFCFLIVDFIIIPLANWWFDL